MHMFDGLPLPVSGREALMAVISHGASLSPHEEKAKNPLSALAPGFGKGKAAPAGASGSLC
jgi:hypothetical protein